MAKKTAANGPGRPLGAKTQDRVVVEHTPDPCPHCRSIVSPIELHNKRRIEGSGRTRDGRQYGAVILRNGRCGACGAALVVRTHEFINDSETLQS